MNILIIGCGKVGSKFAQVLSEEGHDVVILDNDRNAFKLLGLSFRGITITGVPIDQDALKQAGIETADALAALTPDDNLNIMVCQMAKEIFNVPRVLARIFNPAREHVFQQFGLETFCPTNITVDAIRTIILGEKESSKHTIGSNLISFKQEKAQKKYEGKRAGSIKFDGNLLLFGIIRNGIFSFAKPENKIEKNDFLVIAEKID